MSEMFLRRLGNVFTYPTSIPRGWVKCLTPSGGISTFDYVTSGYQFSCALRSSDHKAECWGLDDSGQASPPDVAFLTISAGYRHVCGIQLADYQILCWGLNDSRSC